MKAYYAALLLPISAVLCDESPGYIVSGHWKGGQIPKLEWELDIRRHDERELHGTDDVILRNVVAQRDGVASLPSFTAYEPTSRSYFATAAQSASSANLFSVTISAAVDNTTIPIHTRFNFPAAASLVGLQAVTSAANEVMLLACFSDGSIMKVDPASGASTKFASLLPSDSIESISTAIALDRKAGTLFAVYNSSATRQVASLSLSTAKVTSVALKTLKYHNPAVEQPFQAVWLNEVEQLLVFYAGFERMESFDQIIFVDTQKGDLVFLWKDITQVPSISPPPYPAQYEMQFQDHCEKITACTPTASDFMQTVVVDPNMGLIFFQVTIQVIEFPVCRVPVDPDPFIH
jgi:hypothetical protein